MPIRHCLFALFAAIITARAASTLVPPELRIPFVRQAPVIDGVIGADEWAPMSAVTGFQDYKNKVLVPSDLQSTWWIGFDEHHLYLAQRYPLYPKGTIKARAKTGDHGGIAQDVQSILWDDHVEIQIADTSDRSFPMRNYFYKIMTNPYGALFDHRMEHSVGWFGYEWESQAEIKCRLDNDWWTFEMAIPLRNLGYEQAPADGTQWLMQLVSSGDPESYYFAWQPTAWTDWDAMPLVTFDRKAPAVQITSLGPVEDGKLAAAVHTTAPVTVRFLLNGTEVASQKVNGAATLTADLPIEPDPTFVWSKKPAKAPYTLTIEAVDAAGTTLYRAEPKLVKRPDNLQGVLYDAIASSRGGAGAPLLKTAYLRSANVLQASVDTAILQIPEAIRAAKRFRAGIRKAGEETLLVEREAFIQPDGLGRLETEVPYLPDGDYEALVQVLGDDGAVLSAKADPFTVRAYPWELSQAGREKIVVKPFTPLVREGNRVSPWGRTYAFAETGLPGSVTALGAELLAAPVTLGGVVNGEDQLARATDWPAWTETTGHTCTLSATTALGALRARVEASTEYDGTIFYTLTLEPAARLTVDQLELQIPVKGMAGYQVFRSGRAQQLGAIPAEDGVFWSSDKLPTTPNILGSFLPFAQVTDGERGLLWAADSDQGWMLDDAKPSFFLERRGEAVVLRARLCNRRTQLWEPRTIRFMLQAMPMKPLPEDYRWRAWARYSSNAPVTGSLSCWWSIGTGPTVSFPTDHDYDVFAGLIAKNAEDARKAMSKSFGPAEEILSRWYVATNTMGLAMPEYDTYSGEWLGTTWKKPTPDAHYKDADTPWGKWTNPRQQTRAFADLVQSVVDCRVYSFDQHQKRCGLNGYWWDHDRIWASGKPLLGTGYVRDDGQVQGILNISRMRQMMKRMATCSEINGLRPFHGYYAPNAIGPISAFMQYNWGVESWWYMRGWELDLFDNFPDGLTGLRLLAGRYTGNLTILTTSTNEIPWQGGDTERYPFQSRSVHGSALLMDVGVSEGRSRRDEYNRLVNCLNDFGYFDARVTWVPFWRSGELVKLSDPRAVCTVYLRRLPGRPPAAMLVVFNQGDAPIKVDLALQPGLTGNAVTKVTDVEAAAELPATGVEVKRHDYRLLVVE